MNNTEHERSRNTYEAESTDRILEYFNPPKTAEIISHTQSTCLVPAPNGQYFPSGTAVALEQLLPGKQPSGVGTPGLPPPW